LKNQFTLIALAACFSGTVFAQDVVKIGHVAPLSGPIAHLGKDNEYGARLAIEELNAKGITIGGKKSNSNCWPKMMQPIPSRAQPQPKNWLTKKSMVWWVT
jgi:hypothetical protein